jgi:hypothetical protein
VVINRLFDSPPLCIINGYYSSNIDNLIGTWFFDIDIDNLIEINFFSKKKNLPDSYGKKFDNWPTLVSVPGKASGSGL